MGALVDQQINKYSSIIKGPRYLVFLLFAVCRGGMACCQSAVRLCLLLSNAINRLVCQFLFYFI